MYTVYIFRHFSISSWAILGIQWDAIKLKSNIFRVKNFFVTQKFWYNDLLFDLRNLLIIRYLLIVVWKICWLRFGFVDYNFFSAQVPLQEFLSVILKNVLASQRIILWVLPSSTLQEEFLQLVANLYLLSLESVSQLGEFHSDVVMVCLIYHLFQSENFPPLRNMLFQLWCIIF